MIFLQQGEYGVTLELKFNIDLTAATTIRLRILRPNGTVVDRSLDQSSVAHDGSLHYVIQQGDFPLLADGAHPYRLQAFDVTLGRYVPSSYLNVAVEPNLPEPVNV